MLVLLLSMPGGAGLVGQGLQIELETVATGFNQPLLATHAGDGSGRLFIVEKSGRIRILDGSTLLPAPFLNVTSLVSTCSECGLLGLAFHPDYSDNGLFYVSYTSISDDDSVLARYSVSDADPDLANPASAEILLEVEQPYENHNG
ncbi:MAG: PQQ-dependent sugar dehydrogenase, partial [Thermoanaerobaculia bacterium]